MRGFKYKKQHTPLFGLWYPADSGLVARLVGLSSVPVTGFHNAFSWPALPKV